MSLKKNLYLLLLLLFSCPQAFAKSGREIATQIAPFLSERTVYVVHFDLSQIDFRAVCEEAIHQVEPFLTSFNVDEKSIQGIAREVKKIIRKGEKKIQDDLDTLIDKCGVSDVYILDNDSLQFFAVPLEKRTAAQREALVSFLKDELLWEFGIEIQEHNGFQVFGAFSPERLQELPGKGDAKVQAACEAALKQTTGTTLQAVLLFNSTPTGKEGNPPFPQPKNKIERQWNEFVESMRKTIQSGVLTFDVSKMECVASLQANSESDAKILEQGFRHGIELIGELAGESIQEDRDMAFLAPLVAEFLKGTLKTVQPKRDGNQFVLQYEEKMMFSMMINSFIGAAHFMGNRP